MRAGAHVWHGCCMSITGFSKKPSARREDYGNRKRMKGDDLHQKKEVEYSLQHRIEPYSGDVK